MSALVDHLVDYLTVRRALGYKLRQAEKLLGQFLDHLARGGAETITTEHALAWATLPAGHHAWHHLRLSIVRGFARYLKAIDSDTEVPAEELLPWRPCRAVPYIYTEEQITALIEAAEALRTSHRTATYQTLIGLLTATGMRIGEAISLDRADIGWQAGLLEIRAAKFGKSRELPLDPSAVEALRRYLRRRDRPPAAASTNAVLVSTVGTRLLSCGVEASGA